mmetsp:Transcript_98946/g.277139  ORF Transcript_98946/g.277139 Transcript_98946/m.277139 type:complete len:208 (+) Transcript_98946:1055-1678(+)
MDSMPSSRSASIVPTKRPLRLWTLSASRRPGFTQPLYMAGPSNGAAASAPNSNNKPTARASLMATACTRGLGSDAWPSIGASKTRSNSAGDNDSSKARNAAMSIFFAVSKSLKASWCPRRRLLHDLPRRSSAGASAVGSAASGATPSAETSEGPAASACSSSGLTPTSDSAPSVSKVSSFGASSSGMRMYMDCRDIVAALSRLRDEL